LLLSFTAVLNSDDDGAFGGVLPLSEWERQFGLRERELSTMSVKVVQLHDVMIRLVVAVRDEANRLRTCGTA